jgi:hypothetical protein
MAKRNGKQLIGGYVDPSLKEWIEAVAGKNFSSTQVLTTILEAAKARDFKMSVSVSESAGISNAAVPELSGANS